MKILEGKHNHNLTTILKSCLFGLIIILPFLAILPSTLYFAFNEHAQNYTHEEVITTYEYETNEVNSVDDLVVGNIYHFVYETNDNTQNILSAYALYLKDENIYQFKYKDVIFFNIRYEHINNYRRLYLSSSSQDSTYFIDTQCYKWLNSTLIDCYIVYNSILNDSITYENFSASDYLGEKNVQVIESEQSPLNAFNTATNNVWNSPIFNWVNDGLGSIAISNMLTVFGIARNTFISNILIYWLSITAIYIIIDIVISAFTILTHLITKKAE